LGAALVDLPVHAAGVAIVDLNAIHADVARAARRVAADDHRQRNVAPAVFGPALENLQPAEVDLLSGQDYLPAWRTLSRLRAIAYHLRQLAELLSLVEQAGRHLGLDQAAHALAQLVQVSQAQRPGHALAAAHRIDQHRDAITAHVLEQQRYIGV